ncbi:MAG: peroxiredoxin [Bacteroidales bacterium]|nr:peroxiredoxin [Bacteroidales bacterium]
MNIGDKIPEFKVKDYKGTIISNESLKGRNIVIFFYPKDGSPVCTTEACSFRDNYEEYLKYDCEVIGISGDSEQSHKNFAKKYNLNFPLITDENNKLRKLFGVKSNIFGLLPGRETFLIDAKGTVRLIFNSQLNANSHIEKTINFLKKYLSK